MILKELPSCLIEVRFSSVQSLSHVRFSATTWIAACQASLSITNSWSLLRLTSIESVMPSSHLILISSRHPLLLLPPIPPSIRVFFNESTLRMRWPKYWMYLQIIQAKLFIKKASLCVLVSLWYEFSLPWTKQTPEPQLTWESLDHKWQQPHTSASDDQGRARINARPLSAPARTTPQCLINTHAISRTGSPAYWDTILGRHRRKNESLFP